MLKEKLPQNTVKSSFSISHNNIVCINCNLENVELLLQILMRAKPIRKSQVMVLSMWCANTTGLFVDQSLKCNVPEKTSNEPFQALWVEISFVNHNKITCAVIYRQHNLRDYFLMYLDKNIKNGVRWLGRLYHGWF